MPCSFPSRACDYILLSHISLVHGGITMKLSLPDHYLNFGRLNFRKYKNTVSASKYTIPNGEQSGPYADRELSEDDCYHIPTEDSRSSSDEISESTPLTTVSLRLQLKPRKQGKKEFLKDVKRCVNTTPKSKVCQEKDSEWKEDY
ncbi:hypothetical protein Zmor_001753 [Zophobas morio]|uniref:Uncharacterized protein n=1 Tax=Zophobas morio TaxID=2755281 RepID=A0AA38J333_9CUCU|nr:hypothetical protein Zmor_001753 [Zophobas morio]